MTHSLEGFTAPLKFQPGDGWVYGVGIDWAGHVVQTISGLPLEDYMEKAYPEASWNVVHNLPSAQATRSYAAPCTYWVSSSTWLPPRCRSNSRS